MNIVCYRWRFFQDGHWSDWILLKKEDLEGFENLQERNLVRGTCEVEALYGVTS